ncbi:response regulator [Suttonella ornithocola]|uniref:Chemotaxis protein CheY n=1 Tax=Suttonella ornithocola TaxID=279832 RepID=A0A380MPF8_9GAMM|nr:response regulator [Suttonella ornithocola]SUO94499.1 Chemotaxis protein CheY [Suttonella ornithocola]
MLRTALIVDDSRLARLTLKRLLVKYDIEVSEAEGVVDAERWIAHNLLPDLVFMDVMMPELDGFEGLARMRKNPETANIPVIMYSGDISEEARKKARDSGATGYLPKPADANRLDHLLNALAKRLDDQPRIRQAEPTTPSAAPAPAKPVASPLPKDIETLPVYDEEIAVAVPPVRADVQPALSNELKSRMDELEHRLSLQAMNSSNVELNADLERQHRDVVYLQRQVVKSERQLKVTFGVSIIALLIALASAISLMLS